MIGMWFWIAVAILIASVGVIAFAMLWDGSARADNDVLDTTPPAGAPDHDRPETGSKAA